MKELMDKKSKQNIYWTKTEHARRPSKSSPLIPRQSSSKKLLELQNNENLIQKSVDTTLQTSTNVNQKLTFKDLCDEDKLRIANLVKELAKLGEEKESAMKTLEDERKNYEDKIETFKRQQQLLVDEKELLLKKFVETEQKLIEVNNEKLKHEQSTKKRSKSRSKEVILAQPKTFVSSTPLNVSLRCVSPIMNDNAKFTQEIDNQIIAYKKQEDIPPILHSTLNSIELENHSSNPNDNSRKQELLTERVRLMNEQNNLRKLIEQQENLLKEKHAQIMLQQQLHREKLIQLKLTNEQQEQQSEKRVNEEHSSRNNASTSPIHFNVPKLQSKPTKIDSSMSSIKSTASNRSEIKQENSLLIDLLIENEKKEKASRKNRVLINNDYQDDDDSQLIEDLFFSKKVLF